MNEQNTNATKPADRDANKDQKPGALGAHPVGTTLGAVGAGAAAGAAGGAIAGPIGAVAGAAVGAVVGGLAGNAVAESINPTIENKYWQDAYATRPYASINHTYEEFAPAYRYGWESYGRRGHQAGTFETVENEMSRGWDKAKGASHLSWDQAKAATRDAWQRVAKASGSNKTDSR
ncbi:MAG: hypothetical protein JSR77_01905 [Planctomycetes bacterium]|nr:hypothetical protein [Planctomycetota bacterium]